MDYVYILKFIGVLVAMFLVDIGWAKYFIHIGKHNAIKAAYWGHYDNGARFIYHHQLCW